VRRVFVVEDEGIVAMELKDHLRERSYEVCGHAMSGEVALRQIPDARPDLVLMDINLGKGISGLDTAERLWVVIDVPVLFITAYHNWEIALPSARNGSFAFTAKPFDPDVLAANIESTLVRHAAAVARRAGDERSPSVVAGRG